MALQVIGIDAIRWQSEFQSEKRLAQAYWQVLVSFLSVNMCIPEAQSKGLRNLNEICMPTEYRKLFSCKVIMYMILRYPQQQTIIGDVAEFGVTILLFVIELG